MPNQRDFSEIRMDGVTYGVAQFDVPFKARARLAQYSYLYMVRKGEVNLELEIPEPHVVHVPEGAILSISGLTPHAIRSSQPVSNETVELRESISPVGVESEREIELIIGEVKNDALAFSSAYSGMRMITEDNAPQLHERLWKIYALIEDELLNQEYNSELAVRVLSEAIVVNLSRFALMERASEVEALPAMVDRRILRVMMIIGRDPGHDWSVAELAKLAGMSRTAFATSFKQHLGTTPLKSVSHARLAKSIFELDKTNRSIDQIAENCGYGSSAAFIRAFQREFGDTPARWRKNTAVHTVVPALKY